MMVLSIMVLMYTTSNKHFMKKLFFILLAFCASCTFDAQAQTHINFQFDTSLQRRYVEIVPKPFYNQSMTDSAVATRFFVAEVHDMPTSDSDGTATVSYIFYDTNFNVVRTGSMTIQGDDYSDFANNGKSLSWAYGWLVGDKAKLINVHLIQD
jgi:hypothetical protein